jgi:hypothetical protein
MLIRSIILAVTVAVASALPSANVDTSKIGPQVGTTVAAFDGIDQCGNRRSATIQSKRSRSLRIREKSRFL